MASYNAELAGISESFTIALADKVRQLKAAGRQVIALQTGDPDFATPAPIVEAAHRALLAGQTHYSDSRGLIALRTAIADKIRRHTGSEYDPAGEVLVTHGAIHAYYVALQAILSPGDEVLIPDPAWQTHAQLVRVLHGVPVRVPALAEYGFMPTFEAWMAALSHRTVALVINSPNNPTGGVATAEYLAQLGQFADQHDLYLISDEVYDHLLYDGRTHTSASGVARPRTLLVNSFSKTYAMTGWRVGYLAAPSNLIDLALKASQYSITNVAAFVQAGALEALTNPAIDADVQTMVDAYARRRALVTEILSEHPTAPISASPPAGAFYVFLDVRRLAMPTNTIASRLLDEAGVSIVPGSAYGDHGEGFLRMTIAASESEIAAGLNAILSWAQAL
ncbi:MAG: pyridoxal phosphate-dependent aminotransferase [Chloroflexi bacterium]|nr:pyridoxal phosphate-dependent aminotransferase [Chloroflexota bacterium]